MAIDNRLTRNTDGVEGPETVAVSIEQVSNYLSVDEIENVIKSDYPDIQYVFKDDFSKGFQGWQYQFDSTGRTGITLTEEARKGNYALQLHSRKVASDEAWCRKGVRLPNNIKKVIFGGYWTFHAINANNPASVSFDFDMQTASGTNRHYFAARYLNYSGGLLTKWQVNTGTPTSQSFTDVTGGTENIPWNESNKPMLNYTVLVLNLETNTYEKLYSNGNEYDLTDLDGTTAGTSLSNFDNGAVNIYRISNRSDASEEGIMTLENTFLGYIY